MISPYPKNKHLELNLVIYSMTILSAFSLQKTLHKTLLLHSRSYALLQISLMLSTFPYRETNFSMDILSLQILFLRLVPILNSVNFATFLLPCRQQLEVHTTLQYTLEGYLPTYVRMSMSLTIISIISLQSGS